MRIEFHDLHKPVKVKEKITDTNGNLVCYKYTFGEIIGVSMSLDHFKLSISYSVKSFDGDILTASTEDIFPVKERNN